MSRERAKTAVIGGRHRKADSVLKATGQALYTDDLKLPRMLHAKLLRSPHAHARILGIDFSAARAMPGVVATLEGREIPGRYGIIPWTEDETALAVEKVRHVGEAVAAIAARDELTADEALAAVRVDYEPLPVLLSPEEAAAHSEIRIHERGNVSKRVDLAFGEVEDGLSRAENVVDESFFYAGSTHAPIEPHCALARVDGAGQLTVWSATQIPHYLHRFLARVLGLPEKKIRVIQPFLGGAFGGKSDPFALEFCAAALALKTGRPVKLLYTREEVFYAHRGRHPMKMRYRLGTDREGRITAVDAKIDIDGGAYSSYGLVTAYYSGQLLTGPYRFPAYRFDATRWFTNKPPCGPKRGHGSVQPRFAFEVALDMAAEKLGIDPIEIRRRNFIGEEVTTINGQKITSNGFLACLEAVERASGWRERYASLPPGRGLGVAGGMYISGTAYPIYPNEMPQTGVQVKLDRSGKVTVFSGASDIGQGASSVPALILAEELGCAPEDVTAVVSDTDLTPVDLGAYSSRVTYMLGLACIEAGRRLRARLDDAVAAKWGIEPSGIRAALGTYHELDGDRTLSFTEAVRLAEAKFGTLGATGSYRTQKLGGDYRGGTIGASPAYSFGAHVAEVTVDEETGVIHVERIWIAHDCGRALNPCLVEGQMEGSAYMGFGEALFEEQDYDGRGLHRGPSLLDYRIPTTLDTPRLTSLVVESIDPNGPYGAKEAGEGPLHPSIPAISNAVWRACGVRLTELPFTPARVLRLLRERRASSPHRTSAS